MKTKRIILVASMLTFALIAEAQEIKEPAVNSSSYKTAIGLRAKGIVVFVVFYNVDFDVLFCFHGNWISFYSVKSEPKRKKYQ